MTEHSNNLPHRREVPPPSSGEIPLDFGSAETPRDDLDPPSVDLVPARDYDRSFDGETLPPAHFPDLDVVATLRDRPQLLLTDVLADGGMSTVFEGTDTVTGAKIAVKVTFLDQLPANSSLHGWSRQEAMIMAKVAKEDGIAHFLEAGVTTLVRDGAEHRVRFLSTLLYESTLKDIIHDPDYSQKERVELLVLACRGVEAAHRHGIVHCDLKPANFLKYGGSIALHDFGVAFIKGDPDFPPQTNLGRAFGTFEMLAPEQLFGTHNFDHRADIFALGVTAHLLLVGKYPHSRKRLDTGAPNLDTMSSPIVTNPQLPLPLRAILSKSMAPSPKDRYQSVDELREDLQRYLSGRPVNAVDQMSRTEALRYRVTSTISNSWRTVAALGGALLLGVLGTLVAQRLMSSEKSKESDAPPTFPGTPAPEP